MIQNKRLYGSTWQGIGYLWWKQLHNARKLSFSAMIFFKCFLVCSYIYIYASIFLLSSLVDNKTINAVYRFATTTMAKVIIMHMRGEVEQKFSWSSRSSIFFCVIIRAKVFTIQYFFFSFLSFLFRE